MPSFRVTYHDGSTGKDRVKVFSLVDSEKALLATLAKKNVEVREVSQKPSLFIPESIPARWLLGILYCAAGLATFLSVKEAHRYGGEGKAFGWALVNVGVWVFLVATVRYAFFVFPWERETRRRIAASAASTKLGTSPGDQ